MRNKFLITTYIINFAIRNILTKHKYKLIIMGKGDKRTKRGKLFSGTYGKSRPRKKVKTTTTKTEEKEEKK